RARARAPTAGTGQRRGGARPGRPVPRAGFPSAALSPAGARLLRCGAAGAVLAAAAVALVPWTVALTVILPSRHLADHWDLAWTGFDVVLACSLLATAAAAARSRRAVQPLAAASAALLFCDAWFDVLTASSGIDLEVAILL